MEDKPFMELVESIDRIEDIISRWKEYCDGADQEGAGQTAGTEL